MVQKEDIFVLFFFLFLKRASKLYELIQASIRPCSGQVVLCARMSEPCPCVCSGRSHPTHADLVISYGPPC